jgi:hypothetical protein
MARDGGVREDILVIGGESSVEVSSQAHAASPHAPLSLAHMGRTLSIAQWDNATSKVRTAHPLVCANFHETYLLLNGQSNSNMPLADVMSLAFPSRSLPFIENLDAWARLELSPTT